MSTIKNNIQSDDFIIRLPVYIQGERDAHILLSSDKNTDNKNAYEISKYWIGVCRNQKFLSFNAAFFSFFFFSILCLVIGGWGNTLSVINKNGNKLAEAFEYNVLNEQKPVKFIVEISKGTKDFFNYFSINA